MNLTFLVGNGFDVGMGLKSKFEDFYKSDIFKNEKGIIYDLIKGDSIYNWSDFELSLGKCTSEIKESQFEEFFDSKMRFDINFKNYMKIEEKNHSYIKGYQDKIINNFENVLLNLEVETDDDILKNNILYYDRDTVIIDFIIFNYTEIFTESVYKSLNLYNKKMIRCGKNNFSYIKINNPIHIHGSLYDMNHMNIIGVDREIQILNVQLFDEKFVEKTKPLLIKPYSNKYMGKKITDQCIDIIKNSNIIMIYGMSLGKTDETWWKNIAEWLIDSVNNLLFIFYYDIDFYSKHFYQRGFEKDIYKQKVVSIFEENIPKNQHGNIHQQIIIRTDEFF